MGQSRCIETSYYKSPRKCLGERHCSGREGCKIGHMEEKLTGLGGLLVHVCACVCAHTHTHTWKGSMWAIQILALVLGTWCCHVAMREDWRRIRVFRGGAVGNHDLCFLHVKSEMRHPGEVVKQVFVSVESELRDTWAVDEFGHCC